MTREELIALSDEQRADWISQAPDAVISALRQQAIQNGDEFLAGMLAHAWGEVMRRGARTLAIEEYEAAAQRRLVALRAAGIIG